MDREEWKRRAKETAVRGFDLPQTKIPPLAIVQIRADARKREELRRHITETLSNKALAKKWGVHEATIEKILAYKIGRHII